MLRLKGEIHFFRFLAGDGDVGGLRTVDLVPGGDFVVSRWQIGERKAAILFADVVVVGLENHDIGPHPGMDVALYGDEFGVLVFCGTRGSAGRLRFVPLAIRFRDGMNIVRRLITIQNLQFLSGVKSDHVWDVLASFLLKRDGVRWDLILIAGSLGYVNHDIGQRVVGSRDNRLARDWSQMFLHAAGLGGHVDRLGLGRLSCELDLSGDCSRKK